MTAGVSARVVAVCTLLCGVTIAHADRRPVAVVDLAGDPAPSKLAQDENPVLLGHPDLQPIPDPSIPAELYGPFRDDDQERITNALNAKVTAEERLGRFELQVAEESTKNGQEELGKATPSVNVLVVYGQLSFIRAQALLGTPTKAARAREFFALAHRLDPAFVPDASRYLPDVVQAFEAAKKAWSGKGTLGSAAPGGCGSTAKSWGLRRPSSKSTPARTSCG